jgi:hypothetical protein
MLIGGVPIESVQQALGHGSINITKDVYAAYVPELADAATRGLAELIAAAQVGPGRLRFVASSARPGRSPARLDRPSKRRGDG